MKKSLKLCMITTFYPPYNFGGDGIYIYRLANELAKRNHHVDVIHCKDSYLLLQNGGPKGNYSNHPNVSVYGVKSRVGFLSPLLTQQTGVLCFKKKMIKAMLDKNRYDVIHYHNMSLIGITALGYGQATKLYTMHEHWLVCPMHVLWKFNREVCTKRYCLLCTIFGKRPPQLWRYTGLLERMLPHVDGFISPSRFTKNKHQELGLDIPIRHIPYFLPKTDKQEDEELSDSPSPDGRPFFLFVGRLEKIKGLQNLIPVFKRYDKYDLLIAGDGTYGSVLKDLAEDAANIKFLGRLSFDKLRDLYRKTLAVIVPSICYEVFGIIIIEAFSVKTPVIVNDLGAMPEVIQDSGGGFVYRNKDELIGAMEKLAKDPDLRRTLGENGFQAYSRHWSEDAHIEQYLNYIQEIQEKKRSYSL